MLDQLRTLIGKSVKVTTNFDVEPVFTGTLTGIWDLKRGKLATQQFVSVQVQGNPDVIVRHVSKEHLVDVTEIR